MPGVKPVMEFFGFTSVTAFMREWKLLDEKDQEQLKQGLSDGTLTYDG